MSPDIRHRHGKMVRKHLKKARLALASTCASGTLSSFEFASRSASTLSRSVALRPQQPQRSPSVDVTTLAAKEHVCVVLQECELLACVTGNHEMVVCASGSWTSRGPITLLLCPPSLGASSKNKATKPSLWAWLTPR